MANILMTLAEDRKSTTSDHFSVIYKVDEEDCFDFSKSLRELGHEVFYVNWKDLKGEEFSRMFNSGESRFVTPPSVDDMDLIFVYKMEGFLNDIPRFEEMVNRFEQSPAVVINDPKTIRHNMDKSYMWNLEQKGVRIIPTYQMNGNIRSLLKDHGRLIIKPRKGERGLDQLLISDEKEVEVLKGREGDYLVQKFMPDIRNGERSLVFLGLDYQHAIIKKPPQDNPDEHRCNESIGGSVSVYYPSEEEIGFARNVLESYNSLGFPVHFSRVDFMKDKEGPVLVEAELLNPSIFANYIGVGREYGDSIANYFHNLLESQPRSDLVRVGDDGNNLHS